MKRIIIAFLALGGLVAGCSGDFLDRELVGETPVEIFETIWNDMDQHYGCFELRGVDWDSLYEVYRPSITQDMTDGQLWRVVTNMLDELNDQHVSIQEIQDNYSTRYFVSGMSKVYATVWFSKTHVLQYLNTPQPALHNDIVESSVIGQDIGYLYLGSMLGYDLDYMHNALERLTSQHSALILDLRANRGGVYSYVQELASWLSSSDDVLWGVQVRTGMAHDEFGPIAWVHNEKATKPYDGKIVILTNRATVSAGEWAVESVSLGHNNVTIIGDTTAGSLSALGMVRFLPNGWQYKYAIQRVTRADGSSYEGHGIPPDIYVTNNSTNYSRMVDSMMIRAVEFLKK